VLLRAQRHANVGELQAQHDLVEAQLGQHARSV
jgi:hypothetical protein